MNLRLGLALTLVLLGACRPTPPPSGAAAERTFDARGEIRRLGAEGRTVVIRHDEIPGYMPRMTMELSVRDPRELQGFAAGDLITFRLHATADTHWIDALQRIGRAAETEADAPAEVAAPPGRELQVGEVLPDAELLAESGGSLRLADFRGHALALTFFFTRCPLPDFCPRMNQRFAEARALLLDRQGAPTNWQFLCVSFDADFDTPAVLQRYAQSYRGTNADRWLFASASPAVLAELAPRLDLLLAREGASISHNLRTVVLDPAGRIRRQFDGNQWSAAELAEAIQTAAAEPQMP